VVLSFELFAHQGRRSMPVHPIVFAQDDRFEQEHRSSCLMCFAI
jgi:hypothetical protein